MQRQSVGEQVGDEGLRVASEHIEHQAAHRGVAGYSRGDEAHDPSKMRSPVRPKRSQISRE
jgi:hypothetical protein